LKITSEFCGINFVSQRNTINSVVPNRVNMN
jgi:hypothetical protein